MNEMNFRNLENLTVPDELMEKLLAIPETEEEKAPIVIPWWRNRSVIAAASLVLVSVLSLIVYFLIGNKIDKPITIKPSSSATEIVWSTDENGETVATEVVIVPDGHNDQDDTSPTEAKSGLARFFERLFGIEDNTSPTTVTGSDSNKTSTTDKTSPNDDRSDSSAPPQGWKPAVPTLPPMEAPTLAPTEVPMEAPTESYDPPDPWDDPLEPTAPPDDPDDSTEPPDEPPVPTESLYKDIISDLVYIGDIPDGSVIYCWLYDDITHYRMYEDDAYTEMFYAEITPLGDGYAFLDYMPKAHGVDLPYAGHYQYLWYLSEDGGHTGRRLYRGDIYLNN